MGLLSYVVSCWIAIQMIIFHVNNKIYYVSDSNQVPIYIAEITPKNLRGGFTTVHQVKQKSYEFRNRIKSLPSFTY